ncbi:MAG TPA: RNA polymerase sigma factor [Burkholderiales bacterium]|nr:RNA polymerase sigma factor [Burkholderiales bacterium]
MQTHAVLDPVERTTDTELIARILAGNIRAFEVLMYRNKQMLLRTARAILRDDAEAEDAVQEAYLRAYWSLGGFRGEAKLSTWLVRIVANEALARLRQSRRRGNIVPIRANDGRDLVPEAVASSADGPQSRAERNEIRRLLEAKIDALPDAYRAVFVLRALEEFSVEETAEALGILPATVRSRFFRARRQLREALSQQPSLTSNDAFPFAGKRCAGIVAAVRAGRIDDELDPSAFEDRILAADRVAA